MSLDNSELITRFLDQNLKLAELCATLAKSEQERAHIDKQILDRLEEISERQQRSEERVLQLEERLYGSANRDQGLVGQVQTVEEEVKEIDLADLKTEVKSLKTQVGILWGAAIFLAVAIAGKFIDWFLKTSPESAQMLGSVVYHFASILDILP